MKTKTIVAKIIDAAAIARQNCKNSTSSTAYCHGPKFIKLSANKGIGRLLLAIYYNPGFTKNNLMKQIFGDKQHGAYAESFTYMKASKLIYNEKGYYITNLGIDLLKQFEIL